MVVNVSHVSTVSDLRKVEVKKGSATRTILLDQAERYWPGIQYDPRLLLAPSKAETPNLDRRGATMDTTFGTHHD
jgi:hypothetical protein